MQNENTHKLAEKIAQILEAETETADILSIQASIEKINARLYNLELASSSPQSTFRTPQFVHPSQERFAVAEAIADAFFDHLSKEKACTFEPNAKPCDHCAMCSSRGY